MPENIKETQEKIEKYYDGYTVRQKRIGVNQRHRSILEKSISAGLLPTHKVLELGCGIGTFTEILADYVQNGEIIAMDISSKSIEIANESIKQKNLKFVYADVTDYAFDEHLKFDFIILPDVLEHIPIELHDKLFKKLAKIIQPQGKIFIHIPDPSYLEWCHTHRPGDLQVIDQPIKTDILVSNTYPNGFVIEELKSYAIWVVNNDYQYIVLRKEGYQEFEKRIEYQPSFLDKVKYKLKNARKK